jgi:glutamate/tyrosine decarboxylase-like PLP-dependent enzyme
LAESNLSRGSTTIDDPLPLREESLDPQDWEALRSLGHRMVDDVLDHLRTVRERPVWQSPPDVVRARLREPLPRNGQGYEKVYHDFVEAVLPYPTGNIHPRFWGWVIGTGTPFTALAEMLAATVNPNVSGFDDAASLVEDRVLAWFKEAMGFPESASGLLVSGGSMANLVGLAVARHAQAPFDVRRLGQGAAPRRMVLYASREVHSSVKKAAELLGLGSDALRLLPVDAEYRLDLGALRDAIATDRHAGLHPYCVVGTVGTVNTGATDDLPALADLCEKEDLWLHVDGAFGALAAFAPALRPRLAGMERADSLAFDPHKWGYFPIEVGCVLVRHREGHRAAFATTAAYLASGEGGIAARTDRFADLGVQLSRGFKAQKVWMGLKAEGTEKLGRLIQQNIEQAAHLAARVRETPALELLAPAPLNIVCFRYRGEGGSDLDRINKAILVRLHESGVAAPSYTVLEGRYALRVCITNHRTRREDLDLLVREVLRLGKEIAA